MEGLWGKGCGGGVMEGGKGCGGVMEGGKGCGGVMEGVKLSQSATLLRYLFIVVLIFKHFQKYLISRTLCVFI